MFDVDVAIFRFFNSTFTNAWFDVIFPYITELHSIWWMYLVLFAVLFKRNPKVGIAAIVLLCFSVGIADFINGHFIKNTVGRIRPCSALEGVRLLVHCGEGKSFPSSHAVNNGVVFILWKLWNGPSTSFIMLFTVLVAFSRIYVGVHYPSDVVAGFSFGMIIGYLMNRSYHFVRSKINISTPELDFSPN